MQGNATILRHLNAVLKNELTAISQYFLHARMFENWGLTRLGEHTYKESIDEMKHADMLIDRILFLEGVPEIARYDVIRVGSDVKEQLENALALEKNASVTYNQGVVIATAEKDAASKMIMEQIIKESEDSIDWLEAQLDLIAKMGIGNYMVTQVGEDKAGGH